MEHDEVSALHLEVDALCAAYVDAIGGTLNAAAARHAVDAAPLAARVRSHHANIDALVERIAASVRSEGEQLRTIDELLAQNETARRELSRRLPDATARRLELRNLLDQMEPRLACGEAGAP